MVCVCVCVRVRDARKHPKNIFFLDFSLLLLVLGGQRKTRKFSSTQRTTTSFSSACRRTRAEYCRCVCVNLIATKESKRCRRRNPLTCLQRVVCI